ncbi:sulfotransferase family protein [Palleronia sediminis]|uniref:Sulfotransferase family protein n=1 Tax=Palleronia sediminis TaxID=2547833 RepID=A0A4R6AHJ5_9RHOB|nr:sulfotransferase [Palleronia sediminis]TDL81106.1 sulfotransferase family protein [Palleronia sediminis]
MSGPVRTTREGLKRLAGRAVAAAAPQCRFDRCIFVLAHMRCGSTALSNVLCSRPDISGYGEAHLRYDGRGALGRLIVNQVRRGGWTPGAAHLFDKILHSRHDRDPDPRFFEARAIFVARHPGPTIRSIRRLFDTLGGRDYATDDAAARYYVERLAALARLWEGFAPERRVGLTHDALIADPDAALARISGALRIDPPLANRYVSPAASRRRGGGDPLESGRRTAIEARPPTDPDREMPDAVPETLRIAAADAYARFRGMIATEADDGR